MRYILGLLSLGVVIAGGIYHIPRYTVAGTVSSVENGHYTIEVDWSHHRFDWIDDTGYSLKIGDRVILHMYDCNTYTVDDDIIEKVIKEDN